MIIRSEETHRKKDLDNNDKTLSLSLIFVHFAEQFFFIKSKILPDLCCKFCLSEIQFPDCIAFFGRYRECGVSLQNWQTSVVKVCGNLQ